MDIKQAAAVYSSIAGIGQGAPAPNPVADAGATSGASSFHDLVSNALSSSVDSGHKAEEISRLALMGKADITELATAVSSAELALNTVVAVRDKVISAYQQIMQMPI
jgi:flagellar hook-basal body complex protein FliE